MTTGVGGHLVTDWTWWLVLSSGGGINQFRTGSRRMSFVVKVELDRPSPDNFRRRAQNSKKSGGTQTSSSLLASYVSHEVD